MSRGISRFALEASTADDTILQYSTPSVETDNDAQNDKNVSFPVRTSTKAKRKFKAPVALTLKTQQTDNIYAEERKQMELARRIRHLANKQTNKAKN